MIIEKCKKKTHFSIPHSASSERFRTLKTVLKSLQGSKRKSLIITPTKMYRFSTKEPFFYISHGKNLFSLFFTKGAIFLYFSPKEPFLYFTPKELYISHQRKIFNRHLNCIKRPQTKERDHDCSL